MQPNFGLAHSRQPVPMKSRAGALAATMVAHLAVIVALVEGLQQVRSIQQSEVIVRFAPQIRKTEVERVGEAPSVIMAFDTPAPPPVVQIAPEAIAAAPPVSFDFKLPPMQLPSPPNSASGGSNARATWETALLARVAAVRYYAPAAKAAKQQGVVLLRFIMDRDGNVGVSRIEKSSGYPALDQAALAALQRAVPLPKPPTEVPGDTLDLIVPVDFYS